MAKVTLNDLINDLNYIESNIESKKANKLQVYKIKRIIKRLDEFSQECDQCNHYFEEVNDQIQNLKNHVRDINNYNLKEYKIITNNIINHLQKVHRLIPKGYYTDTYMAIGISMGLIFGLLLFDNIALGLPLGLAVGLAIGAGEDAKAKKDGKII